MVVLLIAFASMLATSAVLFMHARSSKKKMYRELTYVLSIIALVYAMFDLSRYLGSLFFQHYLELTGILLLPVFGLYYWRYTHAR
ncbi:MAG: hypothetical protein ABH829_04005 [archaeon]